MTEIWKSLKNIVEHGDNYEVSNYGNIRNASTERIVKPFVKKNGYLQVDLYLNGKRKKSHVHRLVALAFIPNPEGKLEVNHKNGDKTNNSVEELEWSTRVENVKHSFDSDLRNQDGSNNPNATLNEEKVAKIRAMYKSGLYLQKELAKLFNVDRLTISNVVNFKSWKHVE
jgi:hypothetical protein